MCLDSERHVRDELRRAARRVIQELLAVEEYASTAQDLASLLEADRPLVVPASEARPGQLSAAALLGYGFRDYPSVLQASLGPPLLIGPESLLGHVSAQCALAALRHNDTQAALAALFLSSLSASHLEPPARETIHHLLLETDPGQSLGLLTLPAWRTGTTDIELSALRRRHQLRFVTTAVQINGVVAGWAGR